MQPLSHSTCGALKSVTCAARARRVHLYDCNNSGNYSGESSRARAAKPPCLEGADVGKGDPGFGVLASYRVATDQRIRHESRVPKDNA